MEKATLDALEREYGQIRGNDDGDGVEHRTLDFVCGLADSFVWCLDPILLVQVPHDVFDHHDCAINHHAKIQRSERKKIGWDMT